MMDRVCIAGWCALAAASAWAGETSQIRREGQYWVLTSSGAESIAAGVPVRVMTRGAVTVRGHESNQVLWRLTARVKAKNEEEAQRILKNARLTAARQRDGVYLTVHVGGAASLELQAPRNIPDFAASTAGGPLEITGMDGAVLATTGGGRVKLERIGGNVTVRTGGGEVVLGSIRGSANCATAGGPIRAQSIGADAVFETGGGEINVDEAGGVVRASTAGGGIRVNKAHGRVFANTAGGPIDVRYAGGTVEARNAAGPIRVASAGGVRLETADGSINLNDVWGSLRASTRMGSIMAQLLAGKPFAESWLTTGSGDITVLIPSNLGVRIQARNEAADTVRRIVSEFPGLHVQLVGSSVIAEGEINGGGPVLWITGNAGTIFIKRLN
jgi:DUF4097 and DUF4098 domain-containing protein YvlB